jgi:biopolymer transport protein ExbD
MSRQPTASERSTTDDMVSGINVTPLVDIALVLLIVFLLTAKMLPSWALSMDFPREMPGRDISVQLGIELLANGDTLVGGRRLPNDDSVLLAAREARAQHVPLQVVIRADSAVHHGRVIHVLDLLKQAGVTKIAFGVGTPTPGSSEDSHKAPRTASSMSH